MKEINIINQKFGKLTVVEKHSTTRNGHIRYVCKCDCGNYVNILKMHLRNNITKSCGCDKAIGKTHKQWKGFEDISGSYWHEHIIRSANGSKGRSILELNITKEYAWEQYIKQDKKCALSGIELKFPIKNKDKSYNISLDRIDSGLGYIEGNIQWVHKDINIMKNKFDNQYFIDFCKLIAKNN